MFGRVYIFVKGVFYIVYFRRMAFVRRIFFIEGFTGMGFLEVGNGDVWFCLGIRCCFGFRDKILI